MEVMATIGDEIEPLARLLDVGNAVQQCIQRNKIVIDSQKQEIERLRMVCKQREEEVDILSQRCVDDCDRSDLNHYFRHKRELKAKDDEIAGLKRQIQGFIDQRNVDQFSKANKLRKKMQDFVDCSDELLWHFPFAYSSIAFEVKAMIESEEDPSYLEPSFDALQLREFDDSAELGLHSLDDSILDHICSFLSRNETLIMRIVSKRMKDVIDRRLKVNTRELSVNTSCSSYLQLVFWCDYFENVTLLTIADCKLDLFPLLFICSRKFSKLKRLSIQTTKLGDDKRFRLQNNCWPQLRTLILKSIFDDQKMNLIDKEIALLIKALPQVEHIEFNRLRITGRCLKQVGDSVKSIKYHILVPPIDYYGMLTQIRHLSNAGKNLEKFSYNSKVIFTNVDDPNQLLFKYIPEKMANLKELVFTSCSPLYYDSICMAHNLRRLSLKAEKIILNPENLSEMENVEKLSLDIENFNDTEVSSVISRFPKVKELRYWQRSLSKCPKTLKVVSNLKRLKSLIIVKPASKHAFSRARMSKQLSKTAEWIRLVCRLHLSFEYVYHIEQEEDSSFIMSYFTRVAMKKPHLNVTLRIVDKKDEKSDAAPENLKIVEESGDYNSHEF